MLFREGGQRVEFVRCVNRAQLGRLGEAEDARFRGMHVAVTGQHFRGMVEVEFAVGPADPVQLGAAGKKFRRAAFIRLDVGALVAKDAVKWLTKLRQGEGIGGRTVENEERFAVGFEDLAHALRDLIRP